MIIHNLIKQIYCKHFVFIDKFFILKLFFKFLGKITKKHQEIPKYKIDETSINPVPTIFDKLLFLNLDFSCEQFYNQMDKNMYDVIDLRNKISDKNISNILNDILKYKNIVCAEELFFLNDFVNSHNIVMIWHGEPVFLKRACNLFFKNYVPPFNHLIVGCGSENKINKLFGITTQKVHRLGNVNIEKIVHNIKNTEPDKIYKKYSIDTNIKKIYFISFSFESFPKSHINFINFKKIEELLNDDELIVYNIHPVVYKNQKNEYYNSAKIKFLQNADKEELLSICCLFVTDYSSSIAESIVLNIPSLVLCENFYTYDRGYFYKKREFPYPLLCTHNSKKIINKFREVSLKKPDILDKNEIIYQNAQGKIKSFLCSLIYNK